MPKSATLMINYSLRNNNCDPAKEVFSFYPNIMLASSVHVFLSRGLTPMMIDPNELLGVIYLTSKAGADMNAPTMSRCPP
mmetsp:Transcript_12374/g.30247  ORF Transcript_12374/g.30247 Transcript_12374/m.30247 type:complete len:80 (-) Transcript_12374:2071-2310(-)